MSDEQSPSRSRDPIDPFKFIDAGNDDNAETQVTDEISSDESQHSKNQADILMQLLEQYGQNSLAPQVYYFIHNHASSENSAIEVIADVRGIQPSTVEKEIRNVEEEIDHPRV